MTKTTAAVRRWKERNAASGGISKRFPSKAIVKKRRKKDGCGDGPVRSPLRHLNVCGNCGSNRLTDDGGEHVCVDCGRVVRVAVDGELYSGHPGVYASLSAPYNRIFYCHERCRRWECCEPTIHPDFKELILEEAFRPGKYPDIRRNCSRETVGRILRSVNISPELAEKHRSTKFKRLPMTKKRFYDKHYEKWKTIRWMITGIQPLTPCPKLVEATKGLFRAVQKPFQQHRHAEGCDGRWGCERYFGCMHNFPSMDMFFRYALQLCDTMKGFEGAYERFKHEFPPVSEEIIKTKIRPLMEKMCKDNGWPMPEHD